MSVGAAMAQRSDSLPWKGSVQAAGATNFGKAGDASLAVSLSRKSAKWAVSGSVSASRSWQTMMRQASYSSDKMRYGHLDTSFSESRSFGEKAALSISYRPRLHDQFVLNVKQSFSETTRRDSTASLKLGVQSGEAVLLGEGRNIEKAEREQRQYLFEAAYLHCMDKPGRSLQSEMSFSRDFSSRNTVRMLDGSLYTPKTYRITPDYEQRLSSFRLFFRDTCFMEVERLDFWAGNDLSWSMNSDIYGGATLVDAVWHDSLLLKQKYLYRSARSEPYVRAFYRWRRFSFYGEERLQYFHHQLWSNLNGWDWSKSSLAGMARLEANCMIGSCHKLKWEYARSITRPDYLQLSGLLRFGSSEGVYYLGNADLKPTKTIRTDLTYTFRSGAWECKAQGGVSRNRNAAEQVLYTGEDKLPEQLRESLKNAVVYSWLNTVSKNNWHLTLRLQWSKKPYEAAVWSVLNRDINKYGAAASISTDFHYSLGCSASCLFGGGWKLSLRNTFDSQRKEVYSRVNSYLSGTVRLERGFGAWRLHAEIREIFDKPMLRTTFSENFDYYRTESVRYYRRLFALGVQYDF